MSIQGCRYYQNLLWAVRRQNLHHSYHWRRPWYGDFPYWGMRRSQSLPDINKRLPFRMTCSLLFASERSSGDATRQTRDCPGGSWAEEEGQQGQTSDRGRAEGGQCYGSTPADNSPGPKHHPDHTVTRHRPATTKQYFLVSWQGRPPTPVSSPALSQGAVTLATGGSWLPGPPAVNNGGVNVWRHVRVLDMSGLWTLRFLLTRIQRAVATGGVRLHCDCSHQPGPGQNCAQNILWHSCKSRLFVNYITSCENRDFNSRYQCSSWNLSAATKHATNNLWSLNTMLEIQLREGSFEKWMWIVNPLLSLSKSKIPRHHS